MTHPETRSARRPLPVSGVMSCQLITVEPGARVGEAARLARRKGVHHLLVVAGSQLVGEVCEFDLAQAAPSRRVDECMTSTVETLDCDASVLDAATTMRERSVGCLPVLWGEHLVGIVTRGDLQRAGIARELLAGPACACCHSTRHVRRDPRGTGVAFCADCLDRAGPPALGEDLGEVD